LAKGLSDSSTEKASCIQEGRKVGSSRTDALKPLCAIVLRIETGQHHATGGGTDGNVGVTVPELDTFLSQSVYIGSDPLCYASKATWRIPVHVICDEPQNIRTSGWLAKLLGDGNRAQQGDSDQSNKS